MYRIEVAPGEETVFRTIEELAIGIRNGVITPRARIYHHASEKWLPIGLHPHYKKALEMPAGSHQPVTTTTPIPTPSRLRTQAPTLPPVPPQPQLVRHSPESHPAAEPKPTPAPQPAVTPRVSSPTVSPVVAMQNEVLRGLPVVSIPEPEPLPWNVPAPRPAAPPIHAHAPKAHPPVAYVPLEFSTPVEEPPYTDTGELLVHRPTARRSRRARGRPVMLLGVATALVVSTHLVLTATPSGFADLTGALASMAGQGEGQGFSGSPAPAETDPPAETRTIEIVSTEAPTTDAPRVTIAPARVAMTPGPAFAGSVPARPGADSVTAAKPTTPKATVPTPTPSSPPVALSIAPGPVTTEMALPDLPPDSVVPTTRTADTLGMKKILRALNGSKPAEVPAAP